MVMPTLLQRGVKRVLALTVRIYFSRIEVRGKRNLPRGPAIYAGEPPWALTDVGTAACCAE